MLRASPYPGKYDNPVPVCLSQPVGRFKPLPYRKHRRRGEEGRKKEKKSLADAGGVWLMHTSNAVPKAEFVPLVTKAHTRQGRLCDHRVLFLGLKLPLTRVCLFRPN